MVTIARDESLSHHERYLTVYRSLRDRDKELAHAFNAPRRSRMLPQLMAMFAMDLIEPAEFDRLTPETRDVVKRNADLTR